MEMYLAFWINFWSSLLNKFSTVQIIIMYYIFIFNVQELLNQKMYHCPMNWKELTNLQQLEEIDQASNAKGVMIFKHSTRCSISDTAKNRLERAWKIEDGNLLIPYYLDLIAYRSISNTIADRYQIAHESPQVLIIYRGKCIFSQTHLGILLQDIRQSLPR